MDKELDIRDYSEMDEALKLAQRIVFKDYLSELSGYNLLLPDPVVMAETPERCIRMLKLSQLSCNNDEDSLQKFSTVFHASMSMGCSTFVMIDSTGVNVDVYLGLRAPDSLKDYQDKARRVSYAALNKGLLSNFPGSVGYGVSPSKELSQKLDDIFREEIDNVSSVSCVASLRSKDKTQKKEFVQGLEKFIKTMSGKSYTAIFIAEPISEVEQLSIKEGYVSLYRSLSPFGKSIWSYSGMESNSVIHGLTHGISETVTNGVAKTQSHTYTHTTGTSNSVGLNINGTINQSMQDSIMEGHSETNPSDGLKTANTISALGKLAASIPTAAISIPYIGPVLGVAKAAGGVVSVAGGAMAQMMQGQSVTDSIVHSMGSTLGGSLGIGGSFAHEQSESNAESTGESETNSKSETKGTTDTESKEESHTEQQGKSLQIEIVNKQIDELLKRIDKHIERTHEFDDYGAYSCGAYFLSQREENVLLAANTYRALLIGEGSSIEKGAVNIWDDKSTVLVMKEYLRRFTHPVFAMPISYPQKNADVPTCMVQTAATIASGMELPLHLGIPTKSVPGFSVVEHAEFGKNIKLQEKPVSIGKLFDMGKVENKVDVSIDSSKLTQHVFTTGSTGTGKSNAIYQLMSSFREKGIKYLVIEPAKGEYKQVFGGNSKVYGTNAKKTPLLLINPFSFPDNIHVLEHIDRMVEIFNACWPMYAAMPAILKDAIEKSYEMRGWNLDLSRCEPCVFPTFYDLMEVLPEVLKTSDYSSDTKSDYSGALITRIHSLTNGINGQILCAQQELADRDLFEENVIVDLSRVGSSETKSLIMGVLVMKLQEYYMNTCDDPNIELRHVTILEEAHNLLRRTSTVQSQEGANLQGKAVEMLTNAIAEMRTYGECFIIADQAPALLDEAVLRNTNTKMVFRLPDESDRQLVGDSIALKDNQKDELSKLPIGVAAVFQNEWDDAVLCQFEKYEKDSYSPLVYKPNDDVSALTHFLKMIYKDHTYELGKEDVDVIREWIGKHNYPQQTIEVTDRALKGTRLTDAEKGMLAYNIFGGNKIAMILASANDNEKGILQVDQLINSFLDVNEVDLIPIIRKSVISTIFNLEKSDGLCNRYMSVEAIRRLLL